MGLSDGDEIMTLAWRRAGKNHATVMQNWLLCDRCLEAVARPRQLSRDRGQDRGKRGRDRDRGRGSENCASRHITVYSDAQSLAVARLQWPN